MDREIPNTHIFNTTWIRSSTSGPDLPQEVVPAETFKMCHDSTRTLQVGRGIADPNATKCSRLGGLAELQGRRWRDTSKRRRRLHPWNWGGWMALACMVLWTSPARAVLLDFDNCISQTILESEPRQLQYVPLDVAVKFDLNDPLHPLNVTVYGNVSGTADRRPDYPAMNDPSWSNPNSTVGNIVDLDISNNKWSTLLTSFDVLNFAVYTDASQFCLSLTQGDCPLGPVFHYNL